MHDSEGTIDISVVVPAFNEAQSLPSLVTRLVQVLDPWRSFELILVDDGSTDRTKQVIRTLHKKYPDNVKYIFLRCNSGKSVALRRGFDQVSGKWVVMIDADLQDNPEEIPRLLTHLQENDFHAVTGWKVNRADGLSKRLPSLFFNLFLRRFSGLNIHDFNCGLKIFKQECLQDLKLYGQLHRFLLVLIAHQGFSVGELPVKHSPRTHGHSKYGNRRLYEGAFDFLTVFFLTRYLGSPLYMFGFYSLVCFLSSVVLLGLFFIMYPISIYFNSLDWSFISSHPAWLISPVLFLAGLILICFGLIGELLLHLLSPISKKNSSDEIGGFETSKDG